MDYRHILYIMSIGIISTSSYSKIKYHYNNKINKKQEDINNNYINKKHIYTNKNCINKNFMDSFDDFYFYNKKILNSK